MAKYLNFTSLGCTRNLVDSEVMIAKLFEKGYALTDDLKKADVFVINTCGFLKEARDEAYSILDEIFENKKTSSKVVICGCMANLFSNEILQRYSVFSILSSGNIDKILEAVENATFAFDKLSYLQDEFSRVITDNSHLAYLKIAEGCSKACSFCIIPKIKGKLKSRSSKSILDEFNLLLSQNIFEINLIAQDLMDFAKDRNEKDGLLKLLIKLLQVDKNFWLRLLYIYPDEITDDFINLIKSDPRICKYLDIPLQHISDPILSKMRRRVSKKDIYSLFEKLKKEIPQISLRVSFMVGFPNETKEDFKELLTFLDDFKVDHLAVFKYSNEEHALSYKFDGQIPDNIKDERFDEITKKQLEIVQNKNKKLIGKTFDAIIDGYHPESNLLINARHQGQAYKVDSNIIINDISKITSFGKIQKVKITNFSGYDLIAEPL